MDNTIYQTVPRKKDKTDWLLKYGGFDKYILDTKILSIKTLKQMLTENEIVVFKPNIGGGGKHVGFVSMDENGFYVMHRKTNTFKFSSADLVYEYIKQLDVKKQFIIQKGIRLLTYKDSPVDIRVSIQRTNKYWSVNGIVAKIAAKQKMITNKSSGGTGVKVMTILKSNNLSQVMCKNIVYSINSVCLNMAKVLCIKYPNLKELGFDVGLDDDFNMYIIEINTKPKYSVYKQAGEMQMFKKIDIAHKEIIAKIKKYKREL